VVPQGLMLSLWVSLFVDFQTLFFAIFLWWIEAFLLGIWLAIYA
jgi:hypothetical protein